MNLNENPFRVKEQVREVDRMACQLYSLTDEERLFVEGNHAAAEWCSVSKQPPLKNKKYNDDRIHLHTSLFRWFI